MQNFLLKILKIIGKFKDYVYLSNRNPYETILWNYKSKTIA